MARPGFAARRGPQHHRRRTGPAKVDHLSEIHLHPEVFGNCRRSEDPDLLQMPGADSIDLGRRQTRICQGGRSQSRPLLQGGLQRARRPFSRGALGVTDDRRLTTKTRHGLSPRARCSIGRQRRPHSTIAVMQTRNHPPAGPFDGGRRRTPIGGQCGSLSRRRTLSSSTCSRETPARVPRQQGSPAQPEAHASRPWDPPAPAAGNHGW